MLNRLIRYIIVACGTLFTSCLGNEIYEDSAYVNPTYDGSTIKSELAINVPVGNSTQPATRMSAEAAQDKSVDAERRFRGIQDIVLIPFKATKNGGGANLIDDAANPGKKLATGSSEFAAQPMSLSAFSSSNIENWYIDRQDNSLLGSSQVYSDVTIPIDTKHFLLYGRAMTSGNISDKDFYFRNGVLLPADASQSSLQNYILNQNTNLSNAAFSLKKVKASDYINNSTTAPELANAQTYILTFLNNLLSVNVPAYNGAAGAASWGATNWKDMRNVTGPNGDENYLNVAGLYNSFIADGRPYQSATAGSSSSVRLRMDALYRSALSYTRKQNNDGTFSIYKRISGTQPAGASLEPLLSSTMAYAIMDAIVGAVTPQGKASKQLFQFTTIDHTETFSWSSDVVADQWLTNFPGYFDLPEGTYQLNYNTSGTDKDKFTFANFTIGGVAGQPNNGQMLLDPLQICYPVELIYMGNSGLRERQGVDDTWRWPTTLEAWNNADGILEGGQQKNYWPNTGPDNTGWYSDRPVNSATTAIALTDQVQYAVASLKTRVKCAATSLTDNRSIYDYAAGDQKVPVPNTGLRITGVLVGNQPDLVDWNMMPKPYSGNAFVDADFSRIVYDRDVPADFYAPYTTDIGTCVPNFTLLLDNDNNSADVLGSAVKVNVALELENNTGVGFYGVNGGFIPVGGKFYIIGQMDISSITDANRNGTKHVFLKDYMTEANFTITALKYAYNVIPDLRSAKLEFGLSVDIDWKSGAVFDINVGGVQPL